MEKLSNIVDCKLHTVFSVRSRCDSARPQFVNQLCAHVSALWRAPNSDQRRPEKGPAYRLCAVRFASLGGLLAPQS